MTVDTLDTRQVRMTSRQLADTLDGLRAHRQLIDALDRSVNRAAAVDLAYAMHAADPPPAVRLPRRARNDWRSGKSGRRP